MKNVFWKKSLKKAEKFITEKKSVSALIKMVVEKLKKTKNITNDVRDNIKLSFELVKLWMKGEYKEVPTKTIVSIIAAFLYFINPLDLIPDFVIKVGLLDDLSILTFVFSSISIDLDNFKKYLDNKKENLLLNKYKGALLGGAIGDAMGAPFEFMMPLGIKITEFKEGGQHNVKKGEWTDDTSMMLCLAESLIEDGFDSKSQMDKYLKWFKEGYLSTRNYCFDIGITTRMAIEQYKITKNPIQGKTEIRTSGNGSIMRLAPIPLFYVDQDLRELIHFSKESSKTTHGSELCLDSCVFMSYIIYKMLNEVDLKKEFVLKKHENIIEESIKTDEVKSIMKGKYLEKSYEELSASGFVVNTLEMALWCFYNSNSFLEGLSLAIGLGDDSDTVGAVYGQIAGVYYGKKGIPLELVEGVMYKEIIEEKATALYSKVINEREVND